MGVESRLLAWLTLRAGVEYRRSDTDQRLQPAPPGGDDQISHEVHVDVPLNLGLGLHFGKFDADLVINEIKDALEVTDQPFFELADDNTFINKKWGKEFLEAIAPLNLNWFTETDISIADDEELLRMIRAAGCAPANSLK